jgi:hypothetical protein
MEDVINEKFRIKTKFLFGIRKTKKIQNKRKPIRYITGIANYFFNYKS